MTFRLPYITPAQGPGQGSPRNSDATQPSNPNLFTNPIPFAQFDWPLTKTVPSLPPRLHHTNPGLFTNPIPNLNLDWKAPSPKQYRAPDGIQQTNINLFTNPIPFKQTDWSTTRFKPAAVEPVPYNLALLGVVATTAPFYQTDWATVRRPVVLSDATQPTNTNLLTNPIPNLNLDWSKPFRTPGLPPQAQPFNNLLFSEVPFFQTDWARPFRVAGFSPQIATLNNLIYSEVPFTPTDFSVPKRPSVPPVDQFNSNLGLLTFVAGAPFYQTDWPRTRTTPIAPPALVLPVNLNLFTNPIPFAQFDWTPLAKAPRWLVEPDLPNIALENTAPVIVPPTHPAVGWVGKYRLKTHYEHSKQRWVNLLEEIRDEEAVPTKAKSAVKAVRQAKAVVLEVVEARNLEQEQAVELAQLYEAARSAAKATEAIARAEEAIRFAQALMDDEDEDDIMLMMWTLQ